MAFGDKFGTGEGFLGRLFGGQQDPIQTTASPLNETTLGPYTSNYADSVEEQNYDVGDIVQSLGPIDSGAQTAVNNNQKDMLDAFEFDWGQYGDREAKAREAYDFAQKYGGSSDFDPSTGIYNKYWNPFGFREDPSFGDIGMTDASGMPISYQDFVSQHQSLYGGQSTVHQKELERSKPFGKFKWGEGLLDAAEHMSKSAGNDFYKYELF